MSGLAFAALILLQASLDIAVGLPAVVHHGVHDENEGPLYFSCGEELIPYVKFCDGDYHCTDKSDEYKISIVGKHIEPLAYYQWCNNHKNGYNGSCLVPRGKICNEEVICRGLTPCDVECDNHYRCQNSTCVHRKTVCNANPCDGCEENHDWQNGVGFKCYRNGEPCVLPQQLTHDGIADCDGGADLCFAKAEDGITRTLDHKKCVQCLDDVTIVASSSVCDGLIDCPDLSDECLCDDLVPPICQRVIARSRKDLPLTTPSPTFPPKSPIPSVQSAVRVEKSSPNYTECTPGRVMCEDGRCIYRRDICDGIRHCENDESFDICQGTIRCADAERYEEMCRCSPPICSLHYGTACDGKADCPIPLRLKPKEKIVTENIHPEDECDAGCPVNASNTTFPCQPLNFYTVVRLSDTYWSCRVTRPNGSYWEYLRKDKICDGVADCQEARDENGCPDRFECDVKRAGYISIELEKTCDGTEDCHNGTDESEELCGNRRFHCSYLHGAKVSIQKERVCDFHIACDDETDEMNCTDDRFYCENGDPLFVRRRQTFDGRKDCSDWSDECPMKDGSKNTHIFSSRYELIANPVLRFLVWVMGLLSIIGNSAVIYRESKFIKKAHPASAVVIANRSLVLNLACSDFTMGVYLIGLAGVALKMQGHYCSEDLVWRASNTCVTLGVLSVISSETSVLTMVLLASCRLYAMRNPFQAREHPRKRVIALLLLMAWLTSLVLALLPLATKLGSTFVQEAGFGYNPFSRNVMMSLAEAKTFYGRLVTYDLKPGLEHPDLDDFLSTASWDDLHNSAKTYFVHDHFEIVHYYGYYSTHSVCMPKFFASRSDPAWVFSFSINLFNFLSFMFVASAYGAIRYTARQNATVRGEEGENDKAAKSLQRKILRLIITDFCCWIPICIMSFCKLAGADVEHTAYAFSAIILLPINSALNPLLYSDLPDHLCKKFTRGIGGVRFGSMSYSSQDRRRGTVLTEVLPLAGEDGSKEMGKAAEANV